MTRLSSSSGTQRDAQRQIEVRAEHIHTSSLFSALPGVVHGITRRVPGLGKADGNIGYSAPRDRADAWAMRQQWMAAAGLEASRIVVASQIHGAATTVARRDDSGKGSDPKSRSIGEADAIVTAESGIVAMTLHADCMPILLCDPVRRAVATIHAGWRGTVANVAGETVRRMRVEFGTHPGDVVAYLGPAIGGCCYEVGDDVVSAWQSIEAAASGSALRPGQQKWTFDLEIANRVLLERVGVPASRIETSGICTKCNGDEWFSHRGQGAETGRYGAFIALVDA